MTYPLHYVSQDIRRVGRQVDPEETWSVYREEYPDADSDVPIEGSQERVSRHATEAEAYAEAERLQKIVMDEYEAGRTYVVGLPVVVTVDDNGWVTVEVDLSELSSFKTLCEQSEYDDETIRTDSDTLAMWTDHHSVRNEGHAQIKEH